MDLTKTRSDAWGEDLPEDPRRREGVEALERPLRVEAQDNERNFEALYNLVRANDKLTATIAGTLEAIKGDLSLIKDKLFRKAR